MWPPSSSIVEKLIEFGSLHGSEERNELAHELARCGFAKSVHGMSEFRWLEDLEWEHACAVTKALVLLEELRLTCSAGSVSAVIPAFRLLQGKDPVRAMELAAWIINASANIYIPFGRSGTRVAFELISRRAASWKECWEQLQGWTFCEFARQSRAADAMALQKPQGERRRAIQRAVGRAAAAERRELQRARSQAREKLIEELRTLSALERLERIAWDNHHPLGYYPKEFAMCEKPELDKLDPVTLERLKAKLADRKGGAWRALGSLLSKRWPERIA
jgi:hypothetical protein